MNNTAEDDFFEFPKIKWLRLAGEVDKSVRFYVRFSQDVMCHKIIKIGHFLAELFKKIKGGRFKNTVYTR